MTLYRYETQYHDVTVDSGLDPRKIPHYPINDFMQSVAGRNLAGAGWDVLAASQAKGAQAMQRDQDIRNISVATGIPEVYLHPSVPQGYSHADLPATDDPYDPFADIGEDGPPPPPAPPDDPQIAVMADVHHDQAIAVAQEQERERDMQLERESQARKKEFEATQQRMYLNRFYGRFAEPAQPTPAEPTPPPLVRTSNVMGARHAMGRIDNPATDVIAAPMVAVAEPSRPAATHIPTADPAGYAFNAGGVGPPEQETPPLFF